MKNKGYALSTIVYPLLLVCLVLILSILFNLNNKQNILNNLKDNVKGELLSSYPTVEVSINKKTATITLSDVEGIVSYAILDEGEPTNDDWIEIEKTTNTKVIWTATSYGTYYIYAKNISGKTIKKQFIFDISDFNYEAILATTTYTATANTSTYAASSGESCSSCRISSVSNYGSCLTASGASGTDSNYHTGTCPDGGTLNETICEF